MDIRVNPDAGLSLAQLEKLAQRLLEKRDELVEQLEALNRKITSREDCSIADPAEAASLRDEATRATGIAEQHRQTLVEIEKAIGRLETGRYGVSDATGEPIGLERLSLVPWARKGPTD